MLKQVLKYVYNVKGFKDKHKSKEERYRRYTKDLNEISRDKQYSIQNKKNTPRIVTAD